MNKDNEKINVTMSSMPTYQEYCEEIKELWETRWLSNRGDKHRKLERELSNYLKVNNVALFANGHVGLEVAISAFKLKGEVITTPYTHCSTTHAIVRNGLIPVFSDINEQDLTIDVNKIEKLITTQTVAIVATHVYGCPCDVYAIEEIAKKYNLLVIYDAAHAFGVELDGKGIASFGDSSMFSCHATKVFHTIEGGIVTFSDNRIYPYVDQLTNFGFTSPETVEYIGTNARMNEFEAAMGICNLRHIDNEIEKRKQIFLRYLENLDSKKGIRLLKSRKNIKPNYSYCPVLFENFKNTRDEIKIKLEKNNIFARKYFYPLTNELECYRRDYSATVEKTPIAKKASESVLALPMYADLSFSDVDNICKIILS